MIHDTFGSVPSGSPQIVVEAGRRARVVRVPTPEDRDVVGVADLDAVGADVVDLPA